jgi:phage FluMu gp28-like protein
MPKIPRNLFTPEERLNFADSFIKVDQQPIDLDFWQQDHIRDTSRYFIGLKSRRTGFSFDVALKGIIKSNDKARFKYTRQFVSYNEEDAKEKINYAKEFYHSIPKKYKKELASESKTSMEFYDKGRSTVSRLISIACRPPRGRGGDIVFDEMAIYPRNKAKVVYVAGLPVIARGGCIEIGSTPLGMMGMFYDIWRDEKEYPNFTRLMVPWWASKALCVDVREAVKLAPHMDTQERVELFGTDIIKTIFSSMFLEDFQQEFECTFIDFALSYIPLDLIYANTPGMREGDRLDGLDEGQGENVDEKGIEIKVFRTTDELLLGYRPDIHGRLFLGYDVARFRDAAVIFLLGQLPNGKKRAVAEIEMVNVKFRVQKENMQRILRGLPVVRGTMDRTGIGLQMCEDLQDEFGETRLEGMDFTPASKELLAIGFKKSLENTELLLHNDKKYQRQIHSIKRMAGQGGIFRYDSQRDEDGHADSFWASALADFAVIEGDKKTSNFYDDWARKKAQGVVQSSDSEPTTGAGSSLTPNRRGKSLNSVIGRITRANN